MQYLSKILHVFNNLLCTYFLFLAPLKSIPKTTVSVKYPDRYNPKRTIIIRLDRLNLSKYKFSKNNPKTVLLPKKISSPVASDSEIPTLNFCEACATSVDNIFENQRKEFVAPYERALQSELDPYEAVSKELKTVEQNWYEEAKKQARLANQLDQLHDRYNEMLVKCQTLRQIASSYYNSTVMNEHCYGKI